jgi:glycosyltransferase involved in cell wall biosynthesis
MILIDALYINNSGGKILLEYLVKKMEESNKNIFYLFDKRCENDFLSIPRERKIYLEASLIKRHQFYLKNKTKFSTVFCFGNLSPTIKLNCKVYTYLHQRLYIQIPKSIQVKSKYLLQFKSFIFKFLLRNTDVVFLQSESIRRDFLRKFRFNEESIQLMPFYENNDLHEELDKEKYTYIYASTGETYKNHLVLFEAFKVFFEKHQVGKLYVTIDDQYKSLIKKIKELQKDGIPIINLGFVTRNELFEYYRTCEYAIYPSLTESFGLGIIEGIENGCKIIGADLEYMNSICKPSLKFNPYSKIELVRALEKSFFTNIEFSEQLVFNQINELIEILK